MEQMEPAPPMDWDVPDFDPEPMGARFWYEQYRQQHAANQQLRQQMRQLKADVEELKEALRKLANRDSETSSQPASAEPYKKKGKAFQKRQQKQGPKYDHPGKTRNRFAEVDHAVELTLEQCPAGGSGVERIEDAPCKRHQVAELVDQPVEVWEYQRPRYDCARCGWQGKAPLPLGCREDFS